MMSWTMDMWVFSSSLDILVLTMKKILEMSFYVVLNQMIEYGKLFGQYSRATVFNGSPRYDEIISEEASGRNIKRLVSTYEACGEVLVMGKIYALITE
jgi:hypothetical protein